VTFGMTATKPETGYGYIKQGAGLDAVPGAFAVDRFVEKPDRVTAEAMLAEGGFAWNSGMFVFRVDTLLAEAERLAPAMVRACREALSGAQADLDFLRLSSAAFEACPSESIDVAIMERTGKAAVVPTEIGWSDVGAWQALWELSERDAAGNVVAGDVDLRDTRDSYLRAEDGKSLAVIGMEGVTVVATGDAVLVARSDRTAEVKDLVADMTAAGKKQAREHPLVYRPWGSYQDIDAGPGFRVKRLIVKPGARLSLQRHKFRSEHWVVVTGVAKVTRGDQVVVLRENESTFIPATAQIPVRTLGRRHRRRQGDPRRPGGGAARERIHLHPRNDTAPPGKPRRSGPAPDRSASRFLCRRGRYRAPGRHVRTGVTRAWPRFGDICDDRH